MNQPFEHQFTGAEFDKLKLRSRVVTAPMTRSWTGEGDEASDLIALFYR